MTQYNTLNIKLLDLQLSKLKSGIKNDTEVTLKFWTNVAGDPKDENNFPHKLSLTNTQVWDIRKTFANNSSENIVLSKPQLHKIGQWGGFLGRRLTQLLRTSLPSMKNVNIPLGKIVLIPLGLTAAASAIHNKMSVSGMPTLIILNEEMNDIMKIDHFQNLLYW